MRLRLISQRSIKPFQKEAPMADSTPVMEGIDHSPAAKRPGLETVYEWITTVDHKKIGIMYVAYALLFLVIGGFEALLMRIQLAVPNNHFVSPQVFNRLFTMHGTTMVFFMGMPMLFGFANYLVPLMIGARDMAFPRLNAFSFWISAFGGLLLYFSYFGGSGLYGAGSAPDVGWFAYAPLTAKAFSPGHSTDYWTLAVFLSGIGSIGTALNVVTTIVCMRCKGMKMTRLPLLVWLYLVMCSMVFIAVGPLTAAQIMLTLDRYVGSHFFDTQAGGSAVLWMHYFWIFGHPEVYILVLPAFAFVNEIVPVFSRKAIFGYPAMVAASIAIGFISLSVWAHHMFTVGLGPAGNTFFVFATMVISVPTGIKIFNWLATIWGGDVHFAVPMMFCIGFLFQFLIAGLTGIMLSVAPFDWQLSASYFVVAHFHYVLVGAIVFALFGAFYYWYPKVTGRMMSEMLGKWHFWLFLIGFHLTFDFMHVPGLLGMPRRIYTYEAGRGWEMWNLIVSIGAIFQVAGIACFVFNLVRSYFRGEIADHDPWDAWTLEWSTSSPPPSYNFAIEPTVHSRRPLWDLKHPEDPDSDYE
jgi:cytochrome c oxidase subunit I